MTSSTSARRISKVRHWKQRWDPEAELVWRRRARVGAGTVRPGDPVDKTGLRLSRLLRLWNVGAIELRDFDPKAPAPRRGRAARLRARATAPPVAAGSIRLVGGGWYEIALDGDPAPRRIRGREAMEEAAGLMGLNLAQALARGDALAAEAPEGKPALAGESGLAGASQEPGAPPS